MAIALIATLMLASFSIEIRIISPLLRYVRNHPERLRIALPSAIAVRFPLDLVAGAMVSFIFTCALLCNCTQTSKHAPSKQFCVNVLVLFKQCDKTVTVLRNLTI